MVLYVSVLSWEGELTPSSFFPSPPAPLSLVQEGFGWYIEEFPNRVQEMHFFQGKALAGSLVG